MKKILKWTPSIGILTLAAPILAVSCSWYQVIDQSKISKETIFLNENNKEMTTLETDLNNVVNEKGDQVKIKIIKKIGYFTNKQGFVQAVTLPKDVEELPNVLPKEVTSIQKMFLNSNIKFDVNILKQWDTSNIISMKDAFRGAKSFNGDISQWNTENVIDMSYMFEGAENFNQDISNWDVSDVVDMSYMFANTVKFNQNLSSWANRLINVKSMSSMFENAISFNGKVDNWNIENVFTTRSMFYKAENFNQELLKWNTPSLFDISGMFKEANSFNNGQLPNSFKAFDLNTKQVKHMSFMFANAKSFNQDISDWDVSNVNDMSYMFFQAEEFNQPLENNKNSWDVSNVNDMTGMFAYAKKFNQNITNWDVKNVKHIDKMFFYARDFKQDLSDWSLEQLVSADDFSDGSQITKLPSKIKELLEKKYHEIFNKFIAKIQIEIDELIKQLGEFYDILIQMNKSFDDITVVLEEVISLIGLLQTINEMNDLTTELTNQLNQVLNKINAFDDEFDNLLQDEINKLNKSTAKINKIYEDFLKELNQLN